MSDDYDPDSDYYDSGDSDIEVRMLLLLSPTRSSLILKVADFDDEPIPAVKGKDKSRDVEYKTLSVSKLQETIDDEISEVASIVGLEVPPSLLSTPSHS